MSKIYYGLDIGTNSVGWAVTDETYRLLKRHGKALWGVRLFKEAQKAEERRGKRTARRRLERRNQRLSWLREIFSAEIAKVDPAFYQRMDESKFFEDDKKPFQGCQALDKYTLFAGDEYNDRDYHREYPTIYHLRKALMTQDHPFDVRLVYLALHHILKNRGHFLFGDMALEDVTFAFCWKQMNDSLQDMREISIALEDEQAFCDAMTEQAQGVTGRLERMAQAAEIDRRKKPEYSILTLLAGGKAKPGDLFGLDIPKEQNDGFRLNELSEAEEARLQELLGENMKLVYDIKRVYDWAVLSRLREGEPTLSHARVALYERHKEDLKRLKRHLECDSKLRSEILRASAKSLDNYVAYTGHGSTGHRCDHDQFCAYLKKKLKELAPRLEGRALQENTEILTLIEEGRFLQKQTGKDNGVIPHQLHEQELKEILKRAAVYLPFLEERDASGLSRSEQILQTFRFRIPYYVGPLDRRSPHAWIERTSEKITPWNFEQVVDLGACAERFITRMTAVCSYLGEPVLPRDSLLYGRFVALNMLNKLRINDREISVELKQRIFHDHLAKDGRTNFGRLKQYLLANGLMQKEESLDGVDRDMRITLSGYAVFREQLISGENEEMVEDIIRHLVLFGEDRSLIRRWLKKTYGERLSQREQDFCVRQAGRFTGWGSLSAAFLTEIKGEHGSIMEALWQTNHNLNELLSSRYSYAQAVKDYRQQKFGAKPLTLAEVLEQSYASPGIRRAIHQTVAIISELDKLLQRRPDRVFIEVTRGEGEKKRTVSRKKQLQDLYAAACKEERVLREQLAACPEERLRGSKLYLYYTQLGKCMYSGEPIRLEELESGYDIDHIYPQSVVKDDSLDNRVLVRKEYNAKKSDTFPIREEIRKACGPFWSMLKDKKLISAEKYRRLTRRTPFDDAERSDFIARQLVETGQAAKIMAELLQRRYGDQTEIVYVKAGNVASFRQDQRLLPDGSSCQAWNCRNMHTRQDPLFVKCREVNDFHHAKDAYLNIVVGNVYHVKFTKNPIRFISQKQTYSLNRMFDFDVRRGDEAAWLAGAEGSIAVVRGMMAKNNVLLTRYARCEQGELFDQQIVPRGEGQAPIKSSDPRMKVERYGGYNKRAGSYFFLVEHTDGKKRRRSLEAVYLMYRALYEKEPLAYCAQILGLKEPRVLIPQIKIGALVSMDGFRMHISGRTGCQIIYKNANPLVIDSQWAHYVKRIGKCMARMAGTGEKEVFAYDGISAEQNEALYRLLREKLNTSRYRVMLETAGETIAREEETFNQLGVAEQCEILLQMLHLFDTTAASANLKKLCGKMGIGILLTSKNLENYQGRKLKLIHQSVTGVYEQEVDLLGDEF